MVYGGWTVFCRVGFSCFVSPCSPAVVQLNCASHHPDNYLVEDDILPYMSLSFPAGF